MSNERNKNGIIIGLLLVIIVILVALVILFATDTISFNKNKASTDNDNSSLINNNMNISQEILNNLYDAIGIPSDNRRYGDIELSYYLSRVNYKDYAKYIISEYGNTWNENSMFTTNGDITDEELCPNGDLHCMFISQENAEKIFKLYNFSGNITDYFNESSQHDNIYAMYITNASAEGKWMGPDTGITHNTTSEYINSSDIKITDNQVVSYYDESNNNELIKISQTVTYDFKKDSEGIYYLSNVEVQ